MPRKTTAPGAELRAAHNVRLAIGRRIALRRAALGLSQSELADRFGVSRTTLSQVEIGAADLNAGDMVYLAGLLKVPVTYFYVSEGDATAQEKVDTISAYLPHLPTIQQDMILNTVVDSYCRLSSFKPKRPNGQAPVERIEPKFTSSFDD